MASRTEKKVHASCTINLEDALPLLGSVDEDERITLESNIIKGLEASFNRSVDQLIPRLKVCKAHKLGRFHKEVIRTFMKNNELVNEYVASFFTWIVDFFPISFVEILFEKEDSVCKYYKKVLMKLYGSSRVTEYRLSVEKHDPDTLKYITKAKIVELVKYPGVVVYLTRNLMHIHEEERLFLIKKYLKRGDLEYYLNTLADNTQDSVKYENDLYEYLNNGVIEETSTKYSVFMSVYNFIKKNDHGIVEDYASAQRVFSDYDVERFLKSDIGVIFLNQTIKYVAMYSRNVQRCKEIAYEALQLNIPRNVGKILWDTLSTDRNTFIECIDKFNVLEDEDLGRILLYGKGIYKGNGPSIRRAINYEGGIYRKEAIDYVAGSFSASEIMDVLVNQDNDERDFLSECIYRKALAGEFDFRVFEIEDSTWLEKTYDQIFRTLNISIYDTLLEKRPELAFDYCFRHKDLRRKYFEKIDKKNCTIEEGICIHKILKHELELMGDSGNASSYAEAVYGCNEDGNEIYMISVAVDPVITLGVVELAYLLTLIRPEDAKYYICEYFDEICSRGSSNPSEEGASGNMDYTEVLGLNDLSLICLIPLYQMIDTILSVHLKNKYLVYTIMDSLLEAITKSTQGLRLTILRNMDSSSVTPNHIVRFINALIPLLHNSNIQICNESKRLLMEIPITTPELSCLRSQMVQSIVDKMYAKSFFEAIRRQQFNHYLCFNALNMLVQTLTMHMRELKEDVFPILNSLQFVAYPQDLKLVFPVIFESLSSFVIENAFYLDECCRVAIPMMKFGEDISFDKLLGSMGRSLRVNKFLVKCLKACDDKVSEKIINKIIRKGTSHTGTSEGEDGKESLYIEPFFLAYAPELHVFKKYIPVFKPLLKGLFLSSDTTKQEIASKAFESMEVVEFLMLCCIVGQWKTRFLCLELFSKKGVEDSRVMAMLFILRNDAHSAIRKRALEIWKSNVVNTNSALKGIYRTVLGFLRYRESNGSFYDAIMSSLNDLVGKYDKYIEKYLKDTMNKMYSGNDDTSPLGIEENSQELKKVPEKKVVEIILIECAKSGKYLDMALEFGIKNSSIDLFRQLLQSPSYREKIIEVIGNRIDDLAVGDMFVGNNQLGIDLFRMTGKTSLFKFLKSSDKMSLLESMLFNEEPNPIHIKELLKQMKPSKKLEQHLLVSDPVYTSIFYGSGEKTDDQGHQKELFIRAFNTLDYPELKPLIIPDYSSLLLDVSYKNVKEPQALVNILCSSSSLRALERLNDVASNMELGESLFILSGHLVQNYLFYEKREAVLPSLELIYKRYHGRLKAFRLIIERLLDGIKHI
ncbi:GCN1-like translational activator [Encephalitozoon romaleae SJ-2008]|uniref:GCN1-like translational activator n=1 Tax=Encephalitozoon romaleae (strain SJ-2008) TaxID=1178016 RepID=I6ZJ59_ENCRO|nr:GCN1-like translational activator [Encephalitozoon romaleae SJ-2008]AFN83258.1 GCN1-like translational activator [Encephalitozoon romaleae SJ-2008]